MNVDLRSVNVLGLFAGGGGLELGIRLAVPGARPVCLVEREAFAAATLVRAMEEGGLDPCPVWTDVTTFDGRPWRGVVDLVAGGFPCQDVSVAGKGAGLIRGARSGLWRHFARVLDEVQPSWAFIENVAALASRGLDHVLADLAEMGFDAEWGVFRASEAGAPHRRERLFVLAHACGLQPERRGEPGDVAGAGCGSEGATRERERVRDAARDRRAGDDGEGLADAGRQGRQGRQGITGNDGAQQPALERGGGDAMAHGHGHGREGERRGRLLDCGRPACRGHADGCSCAWPPGPDDAAGWDAFLRRWPGTEPALRRDADGMALRVDRLRLLGNGVVPQQAALAFRTLYRRLMEPTP